MQHNYVVQSRYVPIVPRAKNGSVILKLPRPEIALGYLDAVIFTPKMARVLAARLIRAAVEAENQTPLDLSRRRR